LFKVDYFGTPSYLIQSPQFYKQMHIINGVESVYEIAPVFRAEPRVTTRHLSEFTSIDLESSKFKSVDYIINFESELLRKISGDIKRTYDIKPIETFTVAEYGELKKILGLRDDESLSNRHEALITNQFGTDGVYIIGYPANERVFYYENNNDISLSFDLIVNGLELTSGGVRTVVKNNIISKMNEVGIDSNLYKPYLDLFDEDVPVHGGFAIGFDRLVAKFMGFDDVAQTNNLYKKPNTTTEILKWK
jgi:aspartyl/asparaginyl-tRNA synthetase